MRWGSFITRRHCTKSDSISDFWQVLSSWDREDCQRWRKVATNLAEAEKHLDFVKGESDLNWQMAQDILASLEPLREKAEFLAAWGGHTGKYLFDIVLKNELRRTVPKKLAKLVARNSNNSRVIFYDWIVELWVRRGGRLSITWNDYAKEPNERVSGPFVDFFEAVAGPLMGSAMPSRQTIRDIVRTQRRRREALREYAALMGQGDDSAHSFVLSDKRRKNFRELSGLGSIEDRARGTTIVVTWGQGQVEARIVDRMRPQSSHWSTKTVGRTVIGWGSLVSCLRNCGAYL